MVTDRMLLNLQRTGFKHSHPTIDNVIHSLGNCFTSLSSTPTKRKEWQVTGRDHDFNEIVVVNDDPVAALCMLYIRLNK